MTMTNEEIKSLAPFPFDYLARASRGENSGGYLIGYSRRYFTLWRVFYNAHCINGKPWSQCFVQNIIQLPACDEDVVAEMFPNLEIDLGLRGMHSHLIKADFEVFRFGKYRGQRIDQCEDGNYLKWFIKNMDFSYRSSEAVSMMVASRLYNLGYTFMQGDEEVEYTSNMWGWWASPLTKERRREDKEKLANGTLDMHIDGRSMYGVMPYEYEGLEEGKTYCSLWRNGITFVFEGKFYPATYHAGEYYLPIINGKAKRVKGKVVNVLDYTILADNAVMVKSFVLEDKPAEEKAE